MGAPVTPTAITQTLRALGAAPLKAFGQHFFCDRHPIAHVVDAAGLDPGDVVLEVGPGRGALTEPLLATGAHVVAVEIDHGLAAHCRELFGAHPRLTLLEENVLVRRALAPAVVAALGRALEQAPTDAALRLVSALPRADAPGDLAAAVTARIERRELLGDGGEPWTATPRRAVRWSRRLSAAAAIALVCTAGWLGWRRSSRVPVVPEPLGHTGKTERLAARGPKPEDLAIRRQPDRREKVLARKSETDADGRLDAAQPAPTVATDAAPSVAMAKTANRPPANADRPPAPSDAPSGNGDDDEDRSAGIASVGQTRGAATTLLDVAHRIEIVSESHETRTAVAQAIERFADTRGRAVRVREAGRTAGAAGSLARMRWLDAAESGQSETVLVVDLPRSQATDLLLEINTAVSESSGDSHVVANGRPLASIAEAGPWIMGGRPPVQVASHEPKMATSRAVRARGPSAALSARRKRQARAPGPPQRATTSRAVVVAEADEGPTRLSAGRTARESGNDVITLAIVLRSPPSALQRPPPPRKASPASRSTATPTSGPAGTPPPPPAGQDGSRG